MINRAVNDEQTMSLLHQAKQPPQYMRDSRPTPMRSTLAIVELANGSRFGSPGAVGGGGGGSVRCADNKLHRSWTKKHYSATCYYVASGASGAAGRTPIRIGPHVGLPNSFRMTVSGVCTNMSSSSSSSYSPDSRLPTNGFGSGHSGSSDAMSQATIFTFAQLMCAFLIAGFGNVGAGIILEQVKEWPVFQEINELYVIIPALLGLKGNLEMTMASRLSTQANLGHMDSPHELLKMAKGNMALVQCQATVVSIAVAIFASLLKSLEAEPMEEFNWNNALVLCSSSLLTANVACFVLGTLMILVIVGSHRCHIDPDNVAAPMAASLGDMTTAALLAVIAHSVYQYTDEQRNPYLAIAITLLFLGMLPIWVSAARNNPYTSEVITRGWTPIVISVFISSCGGFILDYGKSRFTRLPVFQPVINGVGGNLVAVQASRLSTSLHKQGKPGELPSDFKLLTGPLGVFVTRRNDMNVTTARILLLMSIPAHLLYFFVIRAIEGEEASPMTFTFLGLYMMMAVLQVALLLYLAQNLVNLLWRFSIDPDNYSTPLLTATGDLLGCAFLLLVFVIAYQFNDPYALITV